MIYFLNLLLAPKYTIDTMINLYFCHIYADVVSHQTALTAVVQQPSWMLYEQVMCR